MSSEVEGALWQSNVESLLAMDLLVLLSKKVKFLVQPELIVLTITSSSIQVFGCEQHGHANKDLSGSDMLRDALENVAGLTLK